MTHYKDYNIENIKNAIIEHSEHKCSFKEILEKYDITQGVFYHWKRKFENNGDINDKLKSVVKNINSTNKINQIFSQTESNKIIEDTTENKTYIRKKFEPKPKMKTVLEPTQKKSKLKIDRSQDMWKCTVPREDIIQQSSSRRTSSELHQQIDKTEEIEYIPLSLRDFDNKIYKGIL